jgi:hypothetical protein
MPTRQWVFVAQLVLSGRASTWKDGEFMPAMRPQAWDAREARDDGEARAFFRLFAPKKKQVSSVRKAGGARLRYDTSENGYQTLELVRGASKR